MAEFVGKDVDVAGGAVEVGEDERGLILREVGHIAARLFARLGFQIKHVVIGHKAEEERGLRREFVIHLLRGLDLIGGRAKRDWVAIFEGDPHVIDVGILDARAFELGLHELAGDRGHDLADLLAVRGDHLRGVVITAHADVAKLNVVLVAKLFGHLIAEFHELIVDVLDLVFDGFEIAIVGRGGFLAGLAVFVLHEFAHLRKVVNLTAERNFRRSDEGVIFHDEVVFLLGFFDDLLIKAFEGEFGDGEKMSAKLLFQEGTEWGADEGLLELEVRRLKKRHFAVHLLHRLADFLVLGVDGIKNADVGGFVGEVAVETSALLPDVEGLLASFGGGEFLSELLGFLNRPLKGRDFEWPLFEWRQNFCHGYSPLRGNAVMVGFAFLLSLKEVVSSFGRKRIAS